MPHTSAILAFALLALSLPVPATAAESVVGSWATPGTCGQPLSTVVVEPMGLSGEDFSCDFASVSRKGDSVRWPGACAFGAIRKTTA